MKKRILFLASALCLTVAFTGCGKKKAPTKTNDTPAQVQVRINATYTIDGVETDELPDGQHYDCVSVKGSEAAHPHWDDASWSVQYDANTTTDLTVTVDFTPTKAHIKMNNLSYDSLQEAFDDATVGVTEVVDLWADVEGHVIVPGDAKIILNLNGHTIDGKGVDTITNRGNLTINGEGTLQNTVTGENSKTVTNYGTLTLDGVTLTNSTASVTLWNSSNNYSVVNISNCDITHTVNESNVMINSGTMNLYSGVFHAVSGEGYSVLKINHDNAVVNYYDGSFANYAEGFTVTLYKGTFNNLSPNDIANSNNLGAAAFADKDDTDEDGSEE